MKDVVYREYGVPDVLQVEKKSRSRASRTMRY